MTQVRRWILISGMLAAAGALMLAQEPPLPPLPPSSPLAPMPPLSPLPPMPPMDAVAAIPPLPPDLADLPLLAFQDSPRNAAREEAQRARETARTARQLQDRDEQYYHRAKSYLDRKEYERAVDEFNRVIENKSTRADGALYWRAYAQNKQGRRDDALGSLAELQKSYPNSHWLDDAKALQVEVQQQRGTPVSPESATDEDLKLLALNSLMNTDPERSIPMILKLLKSSNSPRLKERALFVLAQNRSQKSRDLLPEVAKGGFTPDLQARPIEYLGI